MTEEQKERERHYKRVSAERRRRHLGLRQRVITSESGGSLYRTKAGTWRCRILIDGKRVSLNFPTRLQAEAALRSLAESKLRGILTVCPLCGKDY